MIMLITIKLKNHLQDTKVSVPLTKCNAKKCILRDIFISEILFRFSAEYSGCRVLVAINN